MLFFSERRKYACPLKGGELTVRRFDSPSNYFPGGAPNESGVFGRVAARARATMDDLHHRGAAPAAASHPLQSLQLPRSVDLITHAYHPPLNFCSSTIRIRTYILSRHTTGNILFCRLVYTILRSDKKMALKILKVLPNGGRIKDGLPKGYFSC